MNIRSLTAMAVMVAALTIAAQARADVIFWLTQGECNYSSGCNAVPTPLSTSDAIKVDVDLTGSNTATITLTAPIVAGTQETFNGPIWFDINDFGSESNYSVSSSSYVNSSAGTGSLGPTQVAGSEDSFGTGFDLGTGSPANLISATISLNLAVGHTWASAANVLTPTTGCAAVYGPSCFEVALQQYSVENTLTHTLAQVAGVAPAPPIGHGFPGILAVAGVLFGAGLLERSRKRRSPGTAISPAAA